VPRSGSGTQTRTLQHYPLPPVKLLHLTNHYPPQDVGSYERQCKLVVGELLRRGHRCRVLTSDHKVRPLPDRDPTVARELRLVRPGRPEARRFFPLLRREQHNHRVLRRHLAEFAPDALVVWGMTGLSASLLAAARAWHIPVVYAVLDHWLSDPENVDSWATWWHGALSPEQDLLRRALRGLAFEPRLCRSYPVIRPAQLSFDHAFFCSRALKEIALNHGVPVDRADVVPLCVALREIPQKQRHDDHLRRLLYVARLDERKDPLTAIRAIHELRQQGHVRFNLDLYGQGDARFEGQLHATIRSFQLGGAVSIKHVADDQLDALYPLYDLLVFTSKYPEPFPLVALKAMAARVPVVSTLSGGCADLIRDGENALAFRAGDHIDLARQIWKVAEDPALAARLTDTAHRDVREHYSVEGVTTRIETLIAAACGQASS
jgi:glycogen(starch) synthase